MSEALKVPDTCKVCGVKVDERWSVFFEVHQMSTNVNAGSLVKVYIDDMKEGKRVFAMDNIDYMKAKLEELDLDSYGVRVTSTMFYLCDACKDFIIKKLSSMSADKLESTVRALEKVDRLAIEDVKHHYDIEPQD